MRKKGKKEYNILVIGNSDTEKTCRFSYKDEYAQKKLKEYKDLGEQGAAEKAEIKLKELRNEKK